MSLKDNILSKKRDDFISNNFNNMELKNAFFWQPFGSQNYPDFLVFTKNFIVPVDIKYSSEKAIKPMWNSNLPKLNGFYVFGSYFHQDVTFFNGSFILNDKERDELINFFENKLKPLENKFKHNMKEKIDNGIYEFKRGFNVYVRRAFEQNKVCNNKAQINYFTADDRDTVENKTIKLLSELE